MYSIRVNINDRPHEKRIPQSWNDVQWTDYINALQADGELIAVLEALTGIPKHIIEAMTETDRTFIEAQCSFFWNEPLVKEGLPIHFVQVHIENDTWQKLIDCEQEFKRVTDAELPQIAAAQLVIKTYSGIDIQGMPVPKALAYWDFFFSNSMSGQNDGQTYTKQQPMRTRLQQVLKNSNRSHGLRPLMPLRKAMSRSMMPSLRQRPMSFIPSYSRIKLRQSTLRAYGSTMNLSVKESNERANG